MVSAFMRHLLGPAAAVCLLLAGCGSSAAPLASPTPSRAASATVPARAGSSALAATPNPAASQHCSAGSATQAVVGLGSNAITGVQFVSPSQGWAVGPRQILATSNGGRTWVVQDSGRLNLSSVDFISNATGWAVGASTVLVTSDGGRTWTELPEPCPIIRSVHFASPQVGFAIAGGSAVYGRGYLAPEMGGVLLGTTDGGRSWQRLSAPANPQSVCFSSSHSGWLGAGGGLYRSTDGGHSWATVATGPATRVGPYTMYVQCAGDSSAWGDDVGPGAAMSQMPHIGYHAGPAGAVPIFAEQYFPHPGVTVTASSPGSYAGPLSAISATTAVYIDSCVACGYGTAPWDLVTGSGAVLRQEGNVAGISQAYGASFLTPSLGWVTGALITPRGQFPRIVRTTDGGRSWQLQYAAG